MNKKFKVVSSIALVGLLTLNAFSVKTLAVEVNDTIKTNPVGIFRELVQGKKVVPFVVAKDVEKNVEDYVTVSEVVNSKEFAGLKITKYNTSNISTVNGNTIVSTGDTFTVEGETDPYTIIVYGDVNKDGKVNSADAATVLRAATGKETLDDIQKEAADVQNNAEVRAGDASVILRYAVGKGAAIDKVPEAEENENYDYTLEVVGGYINNTNEGAVEVNIKLGKQLTEKLEDCTLVAYETGKKENSATSDAFEIPAFTSEIIPTKTLKTDVTGLTTPSVADEKNITIELQDKAGKVLGKTTTIKNTVAPVAINERTERKNTLEANFSFEGFGGNEITKVYYIVGDANASAPTDNDTLLENCKTITVNNNKLEKAPLEGVSAYHKEHKLFYILEDKYGNQSVAPLTVIINTEEAEKETKVSKIEKPDLSTSAAFTFKDAEDNPVKGVKYFATVYKDNKIVGVIEATSTGKDNIDLADPKGDGSENIIADNGAGTYKVSVIIKGDAQANPPTIDSDPIESETVTVATLPKVSNVKVERTENADTLKVSWTNPNEITNIDKYSVDIYEFNTTTKEFDKVASLKKSTNDNTENNVTTTAVTNKDTIYLAKVKTEPVSGKYQYVASEDVDSNQTYIVDETKPLEIDETTKTVTTTSNSATVNVTGLRKIEGLATSYTLKVYTVTGKDGSEDAKYKFVKDVTDVTIDRTDDTKCTIEVEGLQANTRYIFKFVEKIGDAEIVSDYAPNKGSNKEGILTKQIVKPITKLTVSTNYAVDSKVAGKICVNGNEIAVDGTIYDTTDTSYPQELTDAKALVAELKDGDVVTIDKNTVILELNNNIDERDIPTALAGKDLIVKCDTIVAKTLTNKNSVAVKSITLTGNSAMYTITGIKVANITVDKGVRAVKADDTQALKLNEGAEVIVNGVTVSTQKETTILVDSSNANVTVTTNEGANTLRFTNNGSINFVAKGTSNKEVQTGEIYIDTDKDVTISATGVAVDSTIKVISAAKVTSEVAKVIDLTGSGLNGTKTVTVNKDAKSTVIFYSKTDAPKSSNGTQLVTSGSNTVTLRKNYVVNNDEGRDDLKELADAGLISAKDTNGNYISEEVTAVTNYLKSFGIDDANAQLKLEAGNKVTITFEKGATKTVTIGNIK